MEHETFTVLRTPTFKRWFDRLKDRKAKFSIIARIRRLQAGLLGNFKSVGNNVFEVRLDCGPGYRLYATMIDSVVVVLLCGGDKSTQVRDIAQAKRLASSVRAQGGNHEKPF